MDSPSGPVGLLLTQKLHSNCASKKCSLCGRLAVHVSTREVRVCSAKETLHVCIKCDVPEVFTDNA